MQTETETGKTKEGHKCAGTSSAASVNLAQDAGTHTQTTPWTYQQQQPQKDQTRDIEGMTKRTEPQDTTTQGNMRAGETPSNITTGNRKKNTKIRPN